MSLPMRWQRPAIRPSFTRGAYWRNERRSSCLKRGISRSFAPILAKVKAASANSGVLAAKKTERTATRIVIGVQDMADENHMIAADIGVSNLALENGQSAWENRTASLADFIVDAFPFVDRLPGKASGQFLLPFAQDVHRKELARQIDPHAVGVAAEAPKDQRRIERNGVEGIGGVSDKFAPVVAGGDDGHAG